MITFFHTADAHFGVENYGRIDQKTGLNSRFLDFIHNFEYCVNKAIEEDIDFFLFCGDAYKTAYPTPTQQKYFMNLLFKLQKAKIPVVIVVGNHDHPLSFGKTHALDVFKSVPLQGFYVFSKPEVLTLKTKNGKVNIVGIPWPLRNNIVAKEQHRFKDSSQITQYLSKQVGIIIKNFADQLDSSLPSILAGHLTVSSGIFSGSEKCAVFGNDPVFLSSQLAIRPFDYVALGHLHRHQDLNINGYPSVVYSGSIERIDFGERREEKGFCRVKLDLNSAQQERCSYKFEILPTRPMIQIEVHLDKNRNQTEQIIDKIKEQDIDGAIIKIIYHLSDDVSDKVDLLAIQRACSSASYIASIIPIRKVITKDRRVDIKVSMDFSTILDRYFEFKNDIGIDVKQLKKKAFQLYDELQNKDLEMLVNKEKIKSKNMQIS